MLNQVQTSQSIELCPLDLNKCLVRYTDYVTPKMRKPFKPMFLGSSSDLDGLGERGIVFEIQMPYSPIQMGLNGC